MNTLNAPYKPNRLNVALEAVTGFLQKSESLEVIQDLEERPRVEFESGHWLKLYGCSPDTPELHLEKSQDGTIIIRSSDYWCGQTLPRAEVDLESFRSEHAHGWTARGIGTETVATIFHQAMKRHIGPDIPKLDALIRLRGRLLGKLPEHLQEKLSDQYLSGQLQLGLASLIDPETWDICNLIDGKPPTLVEYNTVAGMQSPLVDLLDTNPGVASWFYSTWDESKPVASVNHPGQMVRRMRGELIPRVFTSHHWKFIAALGPETMGAILRTGEPSDSDAMLAIVADSGVSPDPKLIGFIHQEILQSGGYNFFLNEQNEDDPFVHNLRSLAKLLIQANLELNLEDQAMRYEVKDMTDWVRAISREGTPLRARSWAGCRRAANDWHQRQANQRLNARRQQMLAQGNGRILAWNSLVKEDQDGQYNVKPLTDHLMLYDESINMEHCVDGYGNICHAGRSRIFSLLQGNERAATGEIRFQNGHWESVQVRRYRNHMVSSAEQVVMERVVEKYNAVWNRTPVEERHQAWSFLPEPAADPDHTDV